MAQDFGIRIHLHDNRHTEFVFIRAKAAQLIAQFFRKHRNDTIHQINTGSAVISLIWLVLGYVLLYFFKSAALVFIGSLLMMCGYLSGMAVFGAKIRDLTPEGKAGMFQGVRIFSQVLIPGVIGPFIGKTVLKNAETVVNSDGTESFIPNANIFLAALIAAAVLAVFLLVFKKAKSEMSE